KKGSAGVFWASGLGPLVRAFSEPQYLVVAYHSVGTERTKPHLEIAPEVFLRHLEYLKERGYAFRRFSEAEAVGMEKSACIYFDDGFKSVFDRAYPILKSFGIPATLFITTDYLDQKKEPGLYMDWEEARMIRDVFEFGSHSVSHPKLNKIPLAEAKEEMARSKNIIETKFGGRISAFSYPYGRSSEELERAAHEMGYRVTTADKRFHKARPDPDDSRAVFKIKTGIPSPWF
ncbi:MAG: polysaccharide deacetylase family protein, partial [Patescibacteria group bacterium]